MSETSHPSFRSIAAPLDVDDAALNRVNDQLGVPTLTKPPLYKFAIDKREAGAKAKLMTTATPNREQGASSDASADEEIGRAVLEKLTIEVPWYLADAVRRAALDKRTTVRHLVMLALKKDGFQIAAGDLVADGRRTRPKAR